MIEAEVRATDLTSVGMPDTAGMTPLLHFVLGDGYSAEGARRQPEAPWTAGASRTSATSPPKD